LIVISISPIAFTIGSIEVRWYGIFVALAIMVVVLWAVREVKRGAKLSYDTVITAALVGIPSGVVFARLLHVIDGWEYYSQHLGEIVGGGGLTIYGGVLGTALGIWLYSRFSRFKFSYFADMVAPGIILSQAVGRIGCTINGCCHGVATSLPWSVVYTHPDSYCPLGVAIHPTQVYEILWNLAVFAVLLKLRGRFKPDGSLFLIYLGLYSVWRLGVGFLRPGTSFLFGLHQAQVIAIIVLLIAIPLLALRTRWVRQEDNEKIQSGSD